MIVMIRQDTVASRLDALRETLEARGARTFLFRPPEGDVRVAMTGQDREAAAAVREWPEVRRIVTSPRYTLTSRSATGERTRVRIGGRPGAVVGGSELAVVAGPCSVEGRDMLREAARAVRDGGAVALRGGAFKPRTSPYSFEGLGREALAMLAEVRRETGLPVVTEVMSPDTVELVAAHADVLQVGARNMQNYPLLDALGEIRRPVLLKRGFQATLEELLLAAERILIGGNREVILCERGIRTHGRATRFTLDVSAVPVLHRETHLPVVVDPSHPAGDAELVPDLAFAGVAAGADGLLVEVHPDPDAALSDGSQSLTPAAFRGMMVQLAAFAAGAGRTLGRTRRRQAGRTA